ncbi:MAG: D-mannonate oxidoreductase [Acuticoccus sp.]
MTDILQFGTSRFLQAHADLFFDEGTPPRRVTVVQTSGDPARARRLAALAAPEGYPVRIRGLADGEVVDETRHVRSVERTLSTATEWPAVVAAAVAARLIISNTADAGYEPRPADARRDDPQAMSFPAKLALLLEARQRAGAEPVTILPMELITDNGVVLSKRVREVAAGWGADAAVLAHIDACRWMNSLVDRIVSEPIEPAGAVGEPYALWAIEARPGFEAPTAHPDIQVVDDLEPITCLKLFILNLGHSVMAEAWQRAGATPADLTVRAVMDGPGRADVEALLREEILPGFAKKNLGVEAETYLATTLERFANPFLDHKLADIAQNHTQKLERRVRGFFDWSGLAEADAPRLARIAADNGI